MLRDRFQSLDEKWDQMKRQLRREMELSHELHDNWPPELDATLSVDSFGSSTIRAFVYVPWYDPDGKKLEDEAREAATKAIRRHLVRQFGTATRGFREGSGEFYWSIHQRDQKDDDGTFDRLIVLDEAHPEACTVKRVTKTVSVYESSCPKESAETDPPKPPESTT